MPFRKPEVRQQLALLDCLASYYLAGVYLTSLYIAWLHPLPYSCMDPTRLWQHRCFNAFYLVQILAHWSAVRKTAKWNIPSSPPESRFPWPVCTTCDTPMPPRCHHCTACGVCVLRRDHHCFFVRVCIGHWNIRHFLPFLLHTTLGTGHSLYLVHFYLECVHSVSPLGGQIYRVFPPVALAEWCLGWVSTPGFLLQLTFALISAGMIASLLFGGLTLRLVLTGHSMLDGFDSSPGSFSWVLVRSHWSLAFGRCGWVQFLWPCPSMEMYHNGIEWLGKADYQRTVGYDALMV